MSRRPRPEYDSEEFRREWHSDMRLSEMAEKYDAPASSISKAARLRGFVTKFAARYTEQNAVNN